MNISVIHANTVEQTFFPEVLRMWVVVVFWGYVQNLISVEAPCESSALIFCQLHQAVKPIHPGKVRVFGAAPWLFLRRDLLRTPKISRCSADANIVI